MQDISKLQHTYFGGDFYIMAPIARGSFGFVFAGIWSSQQRSIAIKVEPCDTELPQLEYEAHVYRQLAGAVGIPDVHWFGKEQDFNVLALDLLGPSLEHLFMACHRRFSLKTVLLLADQLIPRLRHIHNSNYIHRDIKPANFVMGTGPSAGILHAIDFGLASRYRADAEGSHIPIREDDLVGTARYASISAQQGLHQSRRDDIEAVAYMLIYLATGDLPWPDLRRGYSDYEFACMLRQKRSADMYTYCRDQGLPEVFADVVMYARSLGFMEKPNYRRIRKAYRKAFKSFGYIDDGIFDWTELALAKSYDIDASSSVPSTCYDGPRSSRSSISLATSIHDENGRPTPPSPLCVEKTIDCCDVGRRDHVRRRTPIPPSDRM